MTARPQAILCVFALALAALAASKLPSEAGLAASKLPSEAGPAAPKLPREGGPAAPLLSIDFNSREDNPSISTYPGFTSFLITSNGSATMPQTNATIRMVGPLRLTLTGNGRNPGYTDRSHELPTNQAAFTQSWLLRDSVYSPDVSATGGLNLLIENLPPSNRVKVTVWSFDAISSPVRSSDWLANSVLVRQAYQFTNSAQPINNDQCRFSFKCAVSASGQLLLQGRRNPASIDHGGNLVPSVFLNAVQIEPEPLEILATEATGTELRLTFVIWPQPGQYQVEENAGQGWRLTTGVIYAPPVDHRVTARFAKPTQPKFYRIRYNY